MHSKMIEIPKVRFVENHVALSEPTPKKRDEAVAVNFGWFGLGFSSWDEHPVFCLKNSWVLVCALFDHIS